MSKVTCYKYPANYHSINTLIVKLKMTRDSKLIQA
jgi:hypothetical protein